ncbi:hypothetical protein N185_16905 [Sinorhizobium sp. GW3]|nr:hypothetical protein N185_16905 [Sinorhizobium sp. GW3]
MAYNPKTETEAVIEAYMGMYEISRDHAIIMSSRETPRIRSETHAEWSDIAAAERLEDAEHQVTSLNGQHQ